MDRFEGTSNIIKAYYQFKRMAIMQSLFQKYASILTV